MRSWGMLLKEHLAYGRKGFQFWHMPRNYPIKTQAKIVNACAILHNFIMSKNPSTDILYDRHRRETISIDVDDNNDLEGETNEESDS